MVDALSPQVLADIQAHFTETGCQWDVERFVGFDYDDNPRYAIQPCGALVRLTDDYGSWECNEGHHHHTYGSPAWVSSGDYLD